MTRFHLLALAVFVSWCSTFVPLSAQEGDATRTRDQQARGKALYMDKCSSCHQENLKGTTETPPLTGDMFWANWETYNASNLVDQVRVTMPEDNPGSLERQQYVDIVAYILRANEVPVSGDLPADADALKKIMIKRK